MRCVTVGTRRAFSLWLVRMTNQTPSERSDLRSVTVYGGARVGVNPQYAKKAAELGSYLASKQIDVVYGGSRYGLLGSVADAAIAGGGRVTGIVPEFFTKKPQYEAVGEEIVVPDMHTRKQMMFDKAQAFIAVPGGLGTMEELSEVITWSKLGIHTKPVGILNCEGFYDFFLQWVSHSISEGFIVKTTSPEELFVISEDPKQLVDKLCKVYSK